MSTSSTWGRALLAAVLLGAMVAAGCGDSSLSAEREKVTQLILTESAEQGIVLDEACASEVVSRLPDEDVQALANAEDPDTVAVSAEGDSIGSELVNCIDPDTFVDALVADLEEKDIKVDRDCVRDALEGVDPSAFFDAEAPSADVERKLQACVD